MVQQPISRMKLKKTAMETKALDSIALLSPIAESDLTHRHGTYES